VRRGLLALLAVLALTPLAAGCQDKKDTGAGAQLSERWLRVGEDPSTDVLVYDGALPPNLVDLLNPDTSVAEADRVQLPVHPAGKIAGSYVLRKPDGTNVVWLIYDVAEAPAAVVKKVQGQLDARPWQVVGAQADATGTALRFQSTSGGDLQGTAVVVQRPGTSTYALVVERGGKQVTLNVTRAAAVPNFAASLSDDLTVKRVDSGVAKLAGLKEGDRVVKVGGVDVRDRKSLAAAQQALGSEQTPTTAVTYIIEISPTAVADQRTFVEAPSLALPEKFPVKAFFDGLVVVEFQWAQQAAGSGYAATAISKDGSTTLAGRLKDALQKEGWQILQDVPSGGTTQMQFQHADGRSGAAEIGPFEADSAYSQVSLQVQAPSSRQSGR